MRMCPDTLGLAFSFPVEVETWLRGVRVASGTEPSNAGPEKALLCFKEVSGVCDSPMSHRNSKFMPSVWICTNSVVLKNPSL